ncbi:MAG TPA: hybrid sensor histidine kinase/response regulator [Vicinamibacterales bacterium]|nr:hybrid sensor histidine kinase/response regulator [Vicinamibacterales bacterium]
MRRTLPLWIQLLAIFVGLLAGMAGVLTTSAHRSLIASLAADATRHVSLAAQTRQETLSQLFTLRQQRAVGVLDSLEALCAEPLPSGRLAWAPECVRPVLDDFRKSGRAIGAVLTSGQRVISRSGGRVSTEIPIANALARVVRTSTGDVEYVMRASHQQSALTVQFDHQEVAKLFGDQPALSRSAQVFFVTANGEFLDSSAERVSAGERGTAAWASRCRSGDDAFVDVDYRGVKSFQSFRPLAALGTACVAATLPYAAAMAPADLLLGELVQHAAMFVAVGIVLSLVAAHWVAAPVRRLALSARRLQTGQFDRPIPLGGPSEVQALGRAFNAMGNNLAELVAKEQSARRDAEDANRSKDEFLATVSHELRTPLTAVLGWAHMLQSKAVSADELRHGLEVIERAGRAQNRLIEDLLDVSRIVSDRLRLIREPVTLTEVVEAALDALRPQAREKSLEIQAELSDLAVVVGDARRLEQVVSNLLWNAIKFTEPPGQIRVTLKRVDREVVLSVSDTGVGISSTFLPYVFDWFRQADARSQSQAGLGLGLGIVRHIVQLHGGNVRAESLGAGKGATFTVTLPVHEAAAPVPPYQAPVQPAPTSLEHRLDRTRILLVEDDEDSRELLRLNLESAGAFVETVSTAHDARREMLADPPDVLVSDIRLAEEDGYSLLRSLREAGLRTPAIAVTAYGRREDAEAARAAGYQIHMPKPVDAARLVEAVETLLRNQDVH